MQGHKSTIGSFSSVVSMMQGPSTSGTDMNQQTSLNHVQNAVDARLSEYTGSSGETACLRATNSHIQRFSNWNSGESSSELDLNNQVNIDGLKTEHGWSSSCSASAKGPEERQFERDDVIFPFNPNTNSRKNQSSLQPYSSPGSSSTITLNLNMGHIANTGNRGKGTEASRGVNIDNASGLESLDRKHTSFGSASCDYIGTSSGSSGHMAWGDNASSSSLVNWGSSCKRKALEDSSGLLCTGESSSSLAKSENCCLPTCPAHNASSSLSVSTTLEDVPITSHPLQHNPRNEDWLAASEAIPLISVVGNVERPLRSFGRSITNVQHHESIPLNLSSTGSARHPNHYSLHQTPGSNSFSDSLELRLTAGVAAANSIAHQSQSLALHMPLFPGNMHPFPWNGVADLRGASSSTSFNFGERVLLEELNLRIPTRDNTEHHMHVPASSGHDPTSWHMPSGNVNNSGAVPPTSWMGSSSSGQSFPSPSWNVSHEVLIPNLHRLSEFSPSSLFPSGVHNGHSTSSSSGHPASTQDSSNHQPYARSALLMGRRGGDVFSAPHSLQAFDFDIEERSRLISEVLFIVLFFFAINVSMINSFIPFSYICS